MVTEASSVKHLTTATTTYGLSESASVLHAALIYTSDSKEMYFPAARTCSFAPGRRHRCRRLVAPVRRRRRLVAPVRRLRRSPPSASPRTATYPQSAAATTAARCVVTPVRRRRHRRSTSPPPPRTASCFQSTTAVAAT